MSTKTVPLDLPALTQEELRDIGLRVRDPDVKDLLWEIARLRQTIKRAHYIAELLYGSGGVMADSWIRQLNEEPSIVEALEADYGSGTPGSRGWRGEVRTPEHEVRLANMKAQAKGRIARRRARARR
ncbi:conserved hypothetical protein [Cupriavidus necator]|uniref:Uncharacterized protein n=1 Tax=Cupriavidus necator TaxID=106590 RepID=A0A1K0JFS2_CUPNE|nr:conserved hypothetical protein [Cupriavidus necator]